MKLQDCILEVNKVLVSSQEYVGLLDEKWSSANERGEIPKSLFRLYTLADYFGFEKAPPYLDDTARLLFPFLEGMAWGMRDSLCESARLLHGMPMLHERRYSPMKRMSGQNWDNEANDELHNSFKYLLINLTGALDQFAEIAALLLHPVLKGVTAGRATFNQLKKFVKESHSQATPIILTTQEHFAEKLATSLIPFVDCSGDEKNWMELLFLYRNKIAHLGTSAFQYMSFHDTNMEFYTFLPRRWPLFHKQVIKTSTGPSNSGPVSLKDVAERDMIHCDLLEYSQKVTQKSLELLEVGLAVICDAYIILKKFTANELAAIAIMKQGEQYDFLKFND